MVRLVLFLVLFINFAILGAKTLKLGYGRLSLIDLGAKITAVPLVTDESLIKVISVSGLSSEDDKSLVAIQGLKDAGETDLSVNTNAGLYQFHIVLDGESNENWVVQSNASRSRIIHEAYFLSNNRSSIIQLPEYINEYVLAGNPNLLKLKQVKDYYDPEFLKVFALLTNTSSGVTDLVVPTKKAVYKITLNIGGKENENIQHASFIDFN